MKLKSLSELKRPEPKELILAKLPLEVYITDYAKAKAFKINELVRKIHKSSYEWYGFTLAAKDEPELIIDIGLPRNDDNFHQYTGIGPQSIAEYQGSLAPELLINGWIHSHGNLRYMQFSGTDERNHLTVLDYVTTFLRKPIAKKEVLIKGLELLTEGGFGSKELEKGSVSIITDIPVTSAKIMETVSGGFSYGIVIGDSGWHRQGIHYLRRGMLTGETIVTHKTAALSVVRTGTVLNESDLSKLSLDILQKIKPAGEETEKSNASGET